MELPLLQEPAVKSSNPKGSLVHNDLSSGEGQAEQTGTGRNRAALQAEMVEGGEDAVMTGKVLPSSHGQQCAVNSSVPSWSNFHSTHSSAESQREHT